MYTPKGYELVENDSDTTQVMTPDRFLLEFNHYDREFGMDSDKGNQVVKKLTYRLLRKILSPTRVSENALMQLMAKELTNAYYGHIKVCYNILNDKTIDYINDYCYQAIGLVGYGFDFEQYTFVHVLEHKKIYVRKKKASEMF